MRIFLLILAFSWPGSPRETLVAQDALRPPVREALKTFKRARKEAAGPRRLQATERLCAWKDPALIDTLLSALSDNGRSILKLERRIDRLERRRRAVDKLLAWPRMAASKRERLQREWEEAGGDADYRRGRIQALWKENEVLRRGILDALATLPEEGRAKVGERLLGELFAGGPLPYHWDVIHLAGELKTPAAVQALGRLFERSRNPLERMRILDALGASERPEAESTLIAGLMDEHAVVRTSAIHGLAAVGGADAVTALIEAIPREKGRLLEEVVLALRYLTGVSFHDNVPLWKDWWKNSRARYRRPRRRGGKIVREGLRVRESAMEGKRKAGFYGLQPTSHALVFLLDTSASMNEPASAAGTTHAGKVDETKLDRAKRELIKVLNGLPSGVSINIIAYNDEIHPYATSMIRLSDAHRRGMVAWVRSLRAEGRTNIFGALERPILEARAKGQKISKEMVIDTIFLLTDGIPTAGRITDPDLILTEIKRLNADTRIVIHTIGIGRDHAKNLLRELSRSSQGLYVRAR